MRIHFYYEFPKACFFSGCEDMTYLIAADEMFEDMKSSYPEIEFEKFNTGLEPRCVEIRMSEYNSPWVKYGYPWIIIENPDTKKYFVISWWDRLLNILDSPTWDLENCVEIFASIGVHQNWIDFTECGMKYTPISSMALFKTAQDRIEEIYQNNKTFRDKPLFRGHMYGIRNWMKQNPLFEITEYKLSRTDYVDELSQYLVNIDLPAACEVSARSYEILGVQSCLLRPKTIIKTHNPLIPNHHYAQVDVEDFRNIKVLEEAYIEKYEYLRRNQDEAAWIAKNGREWYEQNATMKSYNRVLKEVIDYNKLA